MCGVLIVHMCSVCVCTSASPQYKECEEVHVGVLGGGGGGGEHLDHLWAEQGLGAEHCLPHLGGAPRRPARGPHPRTAGMRLQ